MMEKPTVSICSIFLIHSSIAEYLGWFWNLGTVNIAAVTMYFFDPLAWNILEKYKGVLYTPKSSGLMFIASF